ncbi:MAG: glycosyltransferase family 39 protein [Anaerolineae bacterium]|nr:glycosyltransferase family 39 protein [Anaerolineae bacterium]
MKRWIIPFGLLLLALLVREPTLDRFVTADEPRWLDRSRWFLTGLLYANEECPAVEWGREFAAQGFACTLQIGYPGATTMGMGSLGLLFHYWQTASPDIDLRSFLLSLPIHKLDPQVLASARLPLAVAGALFIFLFYSLLKRLFDPRVALLTTLLVALHPFHIALSRVLHTDALNATFMVLAVLILTGYWLQSWRWYWLPLSAVLGGLALLTKQVGWFLLPYVVVLAGWTLYYRWQKLTTAETTVEKGILIWAIGGRLMIEGVFWALIAGLTFVAFFPAMWVIPVETLQVIFGSSTALAEEGHPHYLLGEITTNPGLLFYPLGWLLRATLFEILGAVGLGIAVILSLLRQRSLKKLALTHPAKVALLLFIALLGVFLSISDKKLVRYALPAFLLIDVFAAMGWWWLWRRIQQFSWLPAGLAKRGTLILGAVILLGQGWLVWNHYPYYFTYHNPLLGGTTGAARLMTVVGWGEGLNEAADYLNQQPSAESLQVVTERFCGMFRPFFVGETFCLNSSVGGILRADYLVYYYNVVQRNLEWPEQWAYLQRHDLPVHQVNLHGLDYVSIYRNPIQHQVDRETNRLPGIFTVFGYNLSADGQLTLFWQNLADESPQLLVGLAPTSGVYPVDTSTVDSAERQWIGCEPAPDFTIEIDTPKAIIKSYCLLEAANIPPGLYDLQLGVGNGATVMPISTSRLAVLVVGQDGLFQPVELVESPR